MDIVVKSCFTNDFVKSSRGKARKKFIEKRNGLSAGASKADLRRLRRKIKRLKRLTQKAAG